jgi:hypothetical protein
LARRTNGGLYWSGAPNPRHPMRTALPSWPWQLQRSASTAGPTKSPSKQDNPVTTDITLTPYRSGDNSARWSSGGRPVNNPVFVRSRFGQHAQMEIPAYRLNMSPSQMRSSSGREWGGGVTSPSSLSSSSSSSSPREDSSSEGVSSHRTLAVTRVALQSHLLCLRSHSHSL